MNFRTRIIAVAIVLLAIVAPASAQDSALFSKYLAGDTAQAIVNSHATQAADVALLVRYSPKDLSLTKPSGTFEVTTTTLLFKSGLASSEAADSAVTCPSGGTAGTIDLTHADCNTIGEVVDVINASAGDYWKAVNWAAFRTDSVNDKFVAAAAASANGKNGVTAVWDTSKTLYFGAVLTANPAGTPSIAPFINDPSNALKPQPELFKSVRAAMLYASVTHTGTAPQFKIYSIAPKFSDSGSSEIVTQIFQTPLTSGTNAVINLGGIGILGRKGEKFMIRSVSTSTATTPYLYAHGSVFPY